MISATPTKIPASLLSLAALGVCLGFILTGPSSSFAQSSGVEARSERPLNRDKKVDAEKAAEQFASTLVDLYRASSEVTSAELEKGGKSEFSLSFFVSIRPNGAARFTANSRPDGTNAEWSGRYREPLMRLYDAFLPRVDDWNDELLVQFDVRPDNVTLKATFVTDPNNGVAAFGGIDQLAFTQKAAASDAIRSQILSASEVTVQKDKIIVVANLPRAGLQPLLTKDQGDR